MAVFHSARAALWLTLSRSGTAAASDVHGDVCVHSSLCAYRQAASVNKKMNINVVLIGNYTCRGKQQPARPLAASLCFFSPFTFFPCFSLFAQLFQACGKLRDGGTSSSGVDEIVKRGKVVVDDKMESSSNKMDQLVSVFVTACWWPHQFHV